MTKTNELTSHFLLITTLILGSGPFVAVTAQQIGDASKTDEVEDPPRRSPPEHSLPGKPSLDGGKQGKQNASDKLPLEDIPSFGEALTRMVIVLACIAGCLFLVYKILLRWSGHRGLFRQGRIIEVIDTTSIGPRKTLHLVRLAGEYFLIGSSDNRLELLAGGRIPNERLTELLGARDLAGREKSSLARDGFEGKLSSDA